MSKSSQASSSDSEAQSVSPESAAQATLAAFAVTLLALCHNSIPEERINSVLSRDDGPVGPDMMLRCARELGFMAQFRRASIFGFFGLPMPFMAMMNDGTFVTVLAAARHKISIFGTATGGLLEIETQLFWKNWSRKVLLLAWRPTTAEQNKTFGWNWFFSALWRYRKPLRAIIVVSFFIQLTHFITPLFFQVVVDKVIVHNVPSTLDVLAIGLAGIYLFEVLLSTLRGYLFPHTTNRIDVELGTRAFSHLLSLPLDYFDKRRVGDSIARMFEVENIRTFITGSALTLVVDAFFAVALISALFLYNTLLAWIVVASLPIYALIAIVFAPFMRVLIETKFNRGADRSAFLVEMVTGVGTLKAMAVENSMRRRADELLAAYVNMSFRVDWTGNSVEQLAQFVSKAVLVLTLYFGAKEVMAGRMTVGELVAFNMLVGHLIEPILKLVNMWRQFQQASISIARVGDILNARSERDGVEQAIVAPRFKGAISFKQVCFRYRQEGENVIRDLSLDIQAGELIGIVGTSGSGKSTLTKLIQGLYRPQEGRIFIDDHDIALLERASLRSQIGVVLQENVLFNCSAAQNIAFGHPEVSFERIIAAARLAGAHDFISELPEGYNTVIGERGSSLSGGQRQRIAIARALVTNPPILILDEATSALDYETERTIQDNMAQIAAGRTVIVIAHRLSTVRKADRIIVFEKGVLHEAGSHDELLAVGGRYAELHNIQAS